jgi:hypothetical protein
VSVCVCQCVRVCEGVCVYVCESESESGGYSDTVYGDYYTEAHHFGDTHNFHTLVADILVTRRHCHTSAPVGGETQN